MTIRCKMYFTMFFIFVVYAKHKHFQIYSTNFMCDVGLSFVVQHCVKP